MITQARQNDLPRHQLTKEAKLWRFQELGPHPRLRNKKIGIFHKGKRGIDLKSHPFPKENEYYDQKLQK